MIPARRRARPCRREPRKAEWEFAMPSKKKMRGQPRRHASPRTPRRSVASRPEDVATRRLNELAETLDIMLPELTARIAAVGHMFDAKTLCQHECIFR